MSIIEQQLPKFTLTLPVSKKKIEYRPFIVREHKALMMALEDNNVASIASAVDQVIKSCTFGLYNSKSLSRADAEYLFVNIRNKSMGETVDVLCKCPTCNEEKEKTLDFTKIQTINSDVSDSTIQLDTNLWVLMTPPSLATSYIASDENSNAHLVTALCIKRIIEGEKVHNSEDYSEDELLEFIETRTYKQGKLISEFFKKLPKVVFDDEYVCTCGQVSKIHLEGIEDFFV